ncbi:DUF4367 domain-containing protein [Bacillus wiedmannii]|uniref:DUF4367 domain-containing protein n=1 Tax=Bacillus wiedmannii TaxID=1890302 RepID=A0A2B6RNC3_9BACI|nr:DUF4367 domain-containing protein [Bacillus wiedmannii]PGD30192.1 DUF4367 domain-containing protein [Bacillus wiedmannii]
MRSFGKVVILLTLFVTVLYTEPTFAKTESNVKISLAKMKRKAEFEVIVPRDLSQNWSLVMKTYPSKKSNRIDKVRLTYIVTALKNYMMLGIEQRKAHESDITSRGTKVQINKYKGRFEAWEGGSPKGGILRWIQNGTYVEMNSSNLTKKELIQLAKSMR